MVFGAADIVIVVVVCLLTLALSVSGSLWLVNRRALGPTARIPVTLARFNRGRLIDADVDLLSLLGQPGWDGPPDALRAFLAFRFQGLPARLDACDTDFVHHYAARDDQDTGTLCIACRRGVLVFLLHDTDGSLDHVRRFERHAKWLADWVSRSAHYPIWVTDSDNRLFWGNRVYHDLAKSLGHPQGEDQTILDGLDPTRGLPDREQRRFRLTFPDGTSDRWIDVTETAENGLTMHHATDVTAVVQAEQAQRSFVQTLTKTFAQLSTGLAIFDRSRQLALFNPALIDLTGLSAEFLSSRPGYLSFFDKLRDASVMPEPRSYARWRERIFDLIAAAEDGNYQETWALPSGRTYRVTGRPHPNGAVAFLLEDISGEVTLTRRFREQLDISHAVIESLEEAVAVFSPEGALSYANSAYHDLWQTSGEQRTGDRHGLGLSVSDASRAWQTQCEASPVWGDFRDFVIGLEERAEWDATVQLKDGRPLDCRFRPLNGGATLVMFCPQPAQTMESSRSYG